ncbi:oleate-induced peroxisomal protein [Cordyceps militaris CM01]|uniref:Oleate-induced peroxisomal protein n=1 Tax=Cordyceps militaris (strain CM01) TaxID=983644 RepID=G3JRY7_CORMM|nr:oleate-induced peroxisomal protein [Cordyceps militaris CM01]EGX88633.1 oleate-induced peroxisomal protein [Cordyceps militaris CM01]
MSVSNGKFESTSFSHEKIPASQLFDVINEQLSDNPDEVKDAIKKGNGIFAFTIKGNSGVTDSWHVDLKSTGRVGKGIGEKPNVTFILDEDNFTKLFLGEANAQNLFMTGKLKIKGNIVKALALQPVLQVVRVKAKL